MDGLKIKLATGGDSEKIALLLLEAFSEFKYLYSTEAFLATVIKPEEVYSRIIEGPVWIAEYHCELVGTVSVVPKKNEVYLRGMAVLPAVQGLKIGFSLLQEVERFATINSSGRLFLRTTPYLDKAIKLYERFGFVKLDKGEEDYFGTASFLMEKILLKA